MKDGQLHIDLLYLPPLFQFHLRLEKETVILVFASLVSELFESLSPIIHLPSSASFVILNASFNDSSKSMCT